MNNSDPLLFSLQDMINDLSGIERKSFIPGTDKRENDIEHSLTVATLCWYICDKYELELDMAKIFKYALSHDFVERYAGDVSTFASAEERAAKVVREKESLDRLSEEFKDFGDIITSMKNYEDKDDEESVFVWSVDKMQQLIMGGLDNWRCYAEAGITYDEFVAKYTELAAKSSKYCQDLFHSLIEQSKRTYYDQPSS